MNQPTTTDRDERIAAFKAAVKNIHAYPLAIALSALTPGYDWRGATKTRMAEAYADALEKTDFYHLKLRLIDLQRLTRMANARASKAHNWREVR